VHTCAVYTHVPGMKFKFRRMLNSQHINGRMINMQADHEQLARLKIRMWDSPDRIMFFLF